MKIARTNELAFVNYLKSQPFLATEKRIQHGYQFTTASGVIINFYYKGRSPDVVTIDVQRDTANVEEADTIRHFARGLAIADPEDPVEFWDWN